jgi:arylsulfatase A-like enzyme
MRLSLALAALASLGAQAGPERPNFVIMMCDDQRWDMMSCAGNRILKTPNMDRIASEGIRFTNAFVTNALCAPSRATFLTGTYSHANGVIDNRNRPISREVPFMPELLRKAGYEVAFCGKSHVQNVLRDREWDYYFGYRGQGNYLKPVVAEGTTGKDEPREGWMDDVVTAKAVDWLKRKHEKPFCLFLWFKAPHRSWERAPRHKDLYSDVEVPRPALWDHDGKGKPRAFLEADNRIGVPKDVLDYQKFVKDFYATIVGVDENIGRVFKALEETGRLDGTVLMHTGDNGFFMGEWQRFDKRFMHEVSIRVPLVIRYPKLVKAGSTCERMAINVDWAPTILDLAGVEVPKAMHGRSLVPLLKGESAGWRKDWYYHYYEYPDAHKVKPHRGVRTERHKLIHYYEEPQEFELYDLEKDPGETENLHGRPEFAELARELSTRLEELRRELGAK